eukprot:10259979-Alexandrium_andersonii.AAC.1
MMLVDRAVVRRHSTLASPAVVAAQEAAHALLRRLGQQERGRARSRERHGEAGVDLRGPGDLE